MRLLEALAASAIAHAAVLAVPTGHLTPGPSPHAHAHNHRLYVELTRKSAIAGARVKSESPPSPPAASPNVGESGVAPSPTAFGIPLPYYYGPREVSERASPIEELSLEAATDGTSTANGKLLLVLLINEHGAVDQVEIESSQLGAVMTQVITERFRRASFSPALRDGHAVKSRMKIEVTVRPPTAIVVPPPPSARPSSAGEN